MSRAIDPREQHARRLAAAFSTPPDALARELDAKRPNAPALTIAQDHLAALPDDAIPALARDALAELIRVYREQREASSHRPMHVLPEAARAERNADRRERRQWRQRAQAERERLLRDDPAEYRARYEFDGIIERFRDEVRGELLADLSATFVLADGRTLTWGAASVTDHEQAANEALGRADQNLTDLARHEEAATLLRRRNVLCLDQAAAVAA